MGRFGSDMKILWQGTGALEGWIIAEMPRTYKVVIIEPWKQEPGADYKPWSTVDPAEAPPAVRRMYEQLTGVKSRSRRVALRWLGES